jgi:trk system potassium uptake protein TrkH
MIRFGLVVGYVGRIITAVGAAMLLCALYSSWLRESVTAGLYSAAALTVIAGISVTKIFYRKVPLHAKEGFVIVALGWISACLFGSLLYIFTLTVTYFPDAFFEAASGFTTTGATIFSDLERLPQSIVLWRCLSQWLGGLGIIAIFVAVMSDFGSRATQLYRAEITGPEKSKISPRIQESARKLWLTYLTLTLVLFLLLKFLGLTAYEAICHTFSTMATGGLSTRNDGIMSYSVLVQWVIMLFTIIGGTNYAFHYLAFKKRSLKIYFRDLEFRTYLTVIGIFTALTALVLLLSGQGVPLRLVLFQIIAVATTANLQLLDYTQWPYFCQALLLMLMFVGGCAGSTSGNIKIGRYLIIFRRIKIELNRMLHPKGVYSLKIGGKNVSDATTSNVLIFFVLWIMFLLLGCAALTLLESMTVYQAFLTSLGALTNLGSVFNPLEGGNPYALGAPAKFFLSALMIIGRLEIYPLLLLSMPNFWKKE